MAAIAAAIDGSTNHAPPRRPEPSAEEDPLEFDAIPLGQAPGWTRPYPVATPPLVRRSGHELHSLEAQPQLRAMIEAVVEIEGPVLDEVVLRRVRKAWGVGRAGRRIRDSFGMATRALARRRSIVVDKHGFLTQEGKEIEHVRVPGDNPDARRNADEVPANELQLAVLNLVRDAKRVGRHELTFEVARLFGWNRRGSDIAAALDRAVDHLLRTGALEDDSGYLKLA